MYIGGESGFQDDGRQRDRERAGRRNRVFAYRQYLRNCDARAYLAAEELASRRRTGVWQQEGGITRPWDFRRLRRDGRR